MKVVVATFNQKEAIVGAFFVIVKTLLTFVSSSNGCRERVQ